MTQKTQNIIRLFVASLLVAAVILYGRWHLEQTRHEGRAQRINCVNNLKQIGLAIRIWSSDNSDLYPCNVSTNDGGTFELIATDRDGFDRNAVFLLKVMCYELATTKILVCPKDGSRKWAADFASLQSSNVSYLFRSGTNISGLNPNEVLAVCRVCGNILYCDGHVKENGKSSDKDPDRAMRVR